MITRDEERLNIYPYAPRPMPAPPPDAGIFDAPLRCLSVNAEWASHFLGALEVLDQWDTWVGTETEIQAALDQIRNALAKLTSAEDCTMPEHEIGVYFPYASATPPSGALYCDGSQHLIASYPVLAGLLGDTWGTGDDGYFVLPDFRSRLLVGDGQIPGGALRVIGDTGGQEVQDVPPAAAPIHHHHLTMSSVSINSASFGTAVTVLRPSGTTSTDDAGEGLNALLMHPPFAVIGWHVWAL